jgi:heat shock protein HslJ
MKKISVIAILLAGLLVLAACGGSTEIPAGTWKLTSLNGSPVLAGTELTIEFKDGQATGYSGCNSFGGAYEQDGKSLKFGELAMTLMACADTGVMDQESAYLAALQAVDTVEVSENSLTLRGPEVELVYGQWR